MSITFQGGQSMPAQGTAAYTALQGASQATQGNVAGNYNPTTGALTTGQGANLTPIYSPPAAGGTKSATPVVTPDIAQADYTAKFNAFNTINEQIKAQGVAKLNQASIDAQTKALRELAASEMNLKQQGIDIQKQTADTAAKEAASKAAAIGIANGQPPPTDTTQPTNPPTNSGTPVATSGGTTGAGNAATAGTIANQGISDATGQYQQGVQTIQQAKDNLVGQMSSQLGSLMAGTIPLSAPQQALVTSLQTQLQQNEAVQMQANNSYTGAVSEAAFRSGGEYTPTQMAGRIQEAISVGVGKIQMLDNSAAKTIADLEQSFQKQTFDIINKQYDILNKQLDDKANAIKSTYDSTVSALKDARDYQMNVDKFNQTKDQNAFDNAFKLEQQAYAEKKDAATEAETSRHNKATEAIESFKAGMGAGTGGLPSNITPAGTDAASQKMTYDQISSTYGPMTALAIKGLTDYSRLPSDWRPGATKGMTRDQAVTLAQALDPTYTEAGAPARQAYMKSLATVTQGSLGGGIQSANKMVNHLVSFATNVEQMGNGPISPYLNALGTAVEKPLSGVVGGDLQKTAATAGAEKNGLQDEMAKFFKGTGATDVQSIHDWGSTLDLNATPKSLAGTVQGTLNLFAGQLNTVMQGYQSTMGRPAPAGLFIQPETMAKLSMLKDKGWTVDIPGVPYTDKDAYLKNGGSQDSLNSAYKQLKDAGIPTTPENILQAAQL